MRLSLFHCYHTISEPPLPQPYTDPLTPLFAPFSPPIGKSLTPCCPLSLLPPPATRPTTLTPQQKGLASIASTTVAMSHGSRITTVAGGMDTRPGAAPPPPPSFASDWGGERSPPPPPLPLLSFCCRRAESSSCRYRCNITSIRRHPSVVSRRPSRLRRRRRRSSRRAGSSSRRSPVRRVLNPSPPVLLP